jgi:leucyl-tRNA---protein transferase
VVGFPQNDTLPELENALLSPRMNTPQTLQMTGPLLDRALAKGYFRGGERMFTTERIYYDQNVTPREYIVYWLRYDLERLQFSTTMRKLLRQSEKFELDFIPYVPSEEYENLYFLHCMHVPFLVSPMIDDFLKGSFGYEMQSSPCVFDSYAVTLRDAGTLVAAGITDLGHKAMAGITSFFNHDYHKLSLGKTLITLKLAQAQQRNCRYFYPGYLVPGIPNFDYKTFVGGSCIEVYDYENESWVPYEGFQFPNYDL